MVISIKDTICDVNNKTGSSNRNKYKKITMKRLIIKNSLNLNVLLNNVTKVITIA